MNLRAAKATTESWLARRDGIDDSNVPGTTWDKQMQVSEAVFQDVVQMSDDEIRALIFHAAERPVLEMIWILAIVRQGVSARLSQKADNEKAAAEGKPVDNRYPAHEIAAVSGLRGQLGQIYLKTIEPFRSVPTEQWQDLADGYRALVRERILEGKVVAYEDAGLNPLRELSHQYQVKFKQMGYPGMLKGMGQ